MKPPSSITFFIDRSLGRLIVADALRKAGESVQIHDDSFAADAPDEEWLTEAGSKGWIVLTKDKKIRHRAVELAAVQSASVSMFTLSAGSIQGSEMAEIFVNALPKIHDFISKNQPPFIARLTRSGTITKIS